MLEFNDFHSNPNAPKLEQSGCATFYDEKRVFFFGGKLEGIVITNKAWIYDIVENEWTEIEPTSETPPARSKCVVGRCKVGQYDCFLMCGGFNNSNNHIKDGIWRYTVQTNTWDKIATFNGIAINNIQNYGVYLNQYSSYIITPKDSHISYIFIFIYEIETSPLLFKNHVSVIPFDNSILNNSQLIMSEIDVKENVLDIISRSSINITLNEKNNYIGYIVFNKDNTPQLDTIVIRQFELKKHINFTPDIQILEGGFTTIEYNTNTPYPIGLQLRNLVFLNFAHFAQNGRVSSDELLRPSNSVIHNTPPFNEKLVLYVMKYDNYYTTTSDNLYEPVTETWFLPLDVETKHWEKIGMTAHTTNTLTNKAPFLCGSLGMTAFIEKQGFLQYGGEFPPTDGSAFSTIPYFFNVNSLTNDKTQWKSILYQSPETKANLVNKLNSLEAAAKLQDYKDKHLEGFESFDNFNTGVIKPKFDIHPSIGAGIIAGKTYKIVVSDDGKQIDLTKYTVNINIYKPGTTRKDIPFGTALSDHANFTAPTIEGWSYLIEAVIKNKETGKTNYISQRAEGVKMSNTSITALQFIIIGTIVSVIFIAIAGSFIVYYYQKKHRGHMTLQFKQPSFV